MEKTYRWIDKLNPRFAKKVKPFIDEVWDKIFITESWRSKERQDYLYSLGRTRKWKKVTWTKKSNHQEGLAIDIAFRGKELYPRSIKKWRDIGDVAKKYGISWGYDLWKKDKPHFQDNGKEYREVWEYRRIAGKSVINNIDNLGKKFKIKKELADEMVALVEIIVDRRVKK